MQRHRFGAIMYSGPLMLRSFSGNAPVFKTGALSLLATHPYEIAGKVSYRASINIRKAETVDNDGDGWPRRPGKGKP